MTVFEVSLDQTSKITHPSAGAPALGPGRAPLLKCMSQLALRGKCGWRENRWHGNRGWRGSTPGAEIAVGVAVPAGTEIAAGAGGQSITREL